MTDSFCCKLYLITIVNIHVFVLVYCLLVTYTACSELKTFKKLVVLGLTGARAYWGLSLPLSLKVVW